MHFYNQFSMDVTHLPISIGISIAKSLNITPSHTIAVPVGQSNKAV